MEKRLAQAASYITEYLNGGDQRRLGLTARYINLLFGNDDVWDSLLRDAIASVLNDSRLWADAWRQELLACGYELAVAAACSPPSWLADEQPAADLNSV